MEILDAMEIPDDEDIRFLEACVYGSLDEVEYYLERGLNPNCSPEQIEAGIDPPLNLILQHFRTEMLDLLLCHGANPIMTNKHGTTPLHVICGLPHSAFFTAAVFFETCARRRMWLQLDARDNGGWTPLQLALTVSRDGDLVELLLAKGANPMLESPQGWTSLGFVVEAYAYNRDTATFRMLNRLEELARTMLVLGADPRLANDQGETTLHLVAKENHESSMDFWYRVLLRMSREAIILSREWIDARDWLGFTPFHRLCIGLRDPMTDYQARVAEWLLSHGADPNSVSSGFATTPLHFIARQESNLSLMERVLDVDQHGNRVVRLDEHGNRPVRLDVQDKFGDTPLHLAARGGHRRMTLLLLEEGADPNLLNAEGFAPLHEAYRVDANSFFLDFLDTCRRIRQSLAGAANVRDKRGNTLLNLALRRFRDVSGAEVHALLCLDADPNLADARGSTALHEVCRIDADSRLLEFLATCRENDRSLQAAVNSQDEDGETPLHVVLRTFYVDCRAEVRALLGLGADPTLPDQRGTTPLHLICLKKDLVDGDLIRMFFAIADQGRWPLPVNASDNQGRTPLQLAVTSLSPGTVDALLDRRADITQLVFPTEAQFDELLRPAETRSNELKLRIAISASTMIERLERRGYELDRSNAMTMMRIIEKLDLFRIEVDRPVTGLLENTQFVTAARDIKVKNDGDPTTLHDLLVLPLEVAAKRFTCQDYFELARDEKKVRKFEADRTRVTCLAHLCKIMWTRFFLTWALDPFVILIHNRLPPICCVKIIENLNLEDLFNICLAVEIQQACEGNQNN
ncbi:serine/threonine-protein phosphatase 6 regulatory ankyrin repeat subunit A-like [Trichogramma pretiosum]|uniref:serine/threonine-protein phosphatase 6 regulatory ankyrin repeat subunit A-like n=1 Tax=Trichogramma pretiosum TaxID=7493 RepID=UPI0006C9E526|nr:serine/threonine-protein phosphatase 6 regulatory ankyrin repeat subunit A-like [Trichogramma pretiosum]